MTHFTHWNMGFFDHPPDDLLNPPGSCGNWKETDETAACAPCGDSDNDGLDDCAPYLGDIDNPDDRAPTLGRGAALTPTNGGLNVAIPFVGTPLSLNHDNGSTSGELMKMRLPLTGAVMPTNLVRVRSEVRVAGRLIRRDHTRDTHQAFVFDWDGKDNAGRSVTTPQSATVDICYSFTAPPSAFLPADLHAAWTSAMRLSPTCADSPTARFSSRAACTSRRSAAC